MHFSRIRLIGELCYGWQNRRKVYHGICQKFEGEMPGLNSLKAKQQAFELVFSGKCPYLQSGEVYGRLCQAAFFCRV